MSRVRGKRGPALLLIVLAAGVAAPPAAWGAQYPERVVFPKDASVLDARRDLGAKGDGVSDDTDALQKGIDLSCGLNQKVTKALFLPKGTYRVTRSLVVKNAQGPWLYGESRDGTVIRLDDGAKGVTAVLRTHPREGGPNSADWFMRNVRHLTIDVGNNPSTDGIRYFATNSGILQNVRIIGTGKVGINAGFLGQSGPNLVQDAVVDGKFETGLLSQWIWGQTLSRVTIRNCRKGLVVSANAVAAEGLVVENCETAVLCDLPNDWGHWSGVLALVGGTLKGDFKGPAIVNKGVLFARDVKTAGYAAGAIQSNSPAGDVKAKDVAEYSSFPAKRLFDDAPATSLRLPIRREPAVPWETDTSKWVCANEHGAVPGDNRDDTAAVQKAIDAAAKAGKTTVYFRGCGGGDPNWYTVEGEVRVHGSVRHVLGLGVARVLAGKKGGKFVVADDPAGAAVVKFQNIDAFGGSPVTIESRGKRAVVVESCGVRIVGDGTGDIFATDCPALVELRKAGQKMWCRQLNPEGTSDAGLVRNAGADLWVLGMKCEGAGVRVSTTKGGRTEVFGVFNYGPGVKENDLRPAFDVGDGASLSVHALREICFGGHTFRVKVRERRGKETRSLNVAQEGGWIGWATYRGGAKGQVKEKVKDQ